MRYCIRMPCGARMRCCNHALATCHLIMAPSSNHKCLRNVTTTIAQPCHMLLLNKRCEQHTSCVYQHCDLACFLVVIRISHTNRHTAHRHEQGELDLCHIHASKDGSSLTDAWQAFCKQLRWQVVEVQVDVVPFRPTPTPLPDLHGHRPRHHITRCQVLCSGSIPA